MNTDFNINTTGNTNNEVAAKSENQLSDVRIQSQELNNSLTYLKQRQSQALSGLLGFLGISKTGNMIKEHERNLLKIDAEATESKARVIKGYELQVLREILNTDIENGKAVLRQRRGVHLTSQAKILVEKIVKDETEFEHLMEARAEEIEKIKQPYLKQKAEEGFKIKVDDFYKVSGTVVNRYTYILDEELK